MTDANRPSAGDGHRESGTAGTPEAGGRKKSKIPLMCATILVSEVLVVYFAALVGFGLRPVPFGWVIGGATAIAALCILAAALLPRYRGQARPGIALGWIAQVLILLSGFVMPSMFFVGAVFAVLWGAAVYWGRRMDRELTAWGR